MRIALAVPARPGVNSGNSVTGDRWERRFVELGHEVVRIEVPSADAETARTTDPATDDRAIADLSDGLSSDDASSDDASSDDPSSDDPSSDEDREVASAGGTASADASIDVLVALHARRCAAAVAESAERFPDRPIVVGLAGTDLYSDLPDDADARRSCRIATRLVVLQEDGIDLLERIDPSFAAKASVVHQSVELERSDHGAKARSDAARLDAGLGDDGDAGAGSDGAGPSYADVRPSDDSAETSDVDDVRPSDDGVRPSDDDLRPSDGAGSTGRFLVAVLAHLRDVKDPLMAARAARLVGDDSTIHVEHAGSPHDGAWRERAEREDAENDRYTWLGALDRHDAHALLARADVLACTSELEGGANVVSEAIALGVPVVGTDIGGTRGLLGDDHPGLVQVGDDEALAQVLRRLETEPAFLDELTSRSLQRRWMVDPAHERSQWDDVLSGLDVRPHET